ncbi:MAG TPA: arylesterase [Bryobacteraceae bacterium]|nr:arylesterase [Bryobacteraceae bacterium]
MRVAYALLIVTCLLFFGCSKSDPEATVAVVEQKTAVQVPTRPADARPIIAIFGDSLSEGLGADPGKSFPDFLQKALDTEGLAYRVVNLGISGDTTTGGLGRINSAIELKPRMVVLELGGNDGLRGVPVAQTSTNLELMIQALQKSEAQVVLAGMSLPPNYGPDYIRSFEKIYKNLAVRYHVTLIPFLLSDIARQIGSRPGLIQRDGIHPTAEGNEVVAHTVLTVIRPLLKN